MRSKPIRHALAGAALLAGVVFAATAWSDRGVAMPTPSTMTKNATQPVVRVSKGHFASERFAEVKRLIDESAVPLVPAIQALPGLLYYHAAVDTHTNTVVNISIWESEQSAKQMDTLAPMLAQRPILEGAGVRFDAIANYVPAWKIEGPWSFGP